MGRKKRTNIHAGANKRGLDTTRLRDPNWFARVVLGTELWPTQREILAAVASHGRIAVKSCHASGKTFVIAVAVLWWLVAHPDGIVVTTAPTWLQVEQIIWGEIRKPLIRAEARGVIKFPKSQRTQLRLSSENYAIGLSTDDSTRFQGYHAGHVLIVIDEAPGVRSEIYEAIEGIRAGGRVHVLAIGNPTIASGPFHEAFTSQRASWKTFTISAFDTPNLHGLPLEQMRQLSAGLPEEEPVFSHLPSPHLVTRRWVYEELGKYGEESPFWASRVLGEFPEQGEDALISLAWIEAAKTRAPKSECTHKELEAGVDVAGPGEDECAGAVRCAGCGTCIALKAWANPDPRGDCVAFLASFKSRLHAVNVDSIGVGYNFGLHLRDQGYSVNSINVGESAVNGERFANKKAEYYWGLRERFQNGEISGITDELLISQLATIRYKQTPQGKIAIESKEDARKRGVKSPDRAEALMLAYAVAEPGIIGFYREQVEHKRAVERAIEHGERPPDPPKHDRLIKRYLESRAYWERRKREREAEEDE